ncbi:MAG: catalase [Planctomycetota bacterium]|nr:catalase [Planctomycetota bacterium]
MGRDGSPEIDLLGADDADAADGGKRDSANAAPGERAADGSELTDEEKDRIRELEATDREVRRHEQAHMSAGGAYAGAASYEYTRGPDGRNYAVGGEVSIDVSKERDPEATIAKMRIVRSAALAPANPSGQDLAVAGQARKQEMEAQQELRQQQIEEMRGGGEGGESSGTGGYGAGGATAGFTDRISSLYSSTFPAQSSRRGIDLIA